MLEADEQPVLELFGSLPDLLAKNGQLGGQRPDTAPILLELHGYR